MKKVTVNKNGKYYSKWKLETADKMSLVLAVVVIGYVVFQVVR